MRKHLRRVLGTKVCDLYIRAAFLADFLKKPLTRMNYRLMRITRMALLAVLCALAGTTKAQWGDFGGSTEPDTAVKDSSAPVVEDGSGWGMDGEESEPQMPKRVAYKRFNPPYDSLREIIYYEGVIEDEDCQTCASDSLYWRARKFLTTRYGGKENMKKFIVEDKKAERLTLKVQVPMMVRYGEYGKAEAGILEYKVTIRFKDNRYKYQFGNFVHIEAPGGVAKDASRTYHEYYMKLKRGYQTTDKYLLAADREVKEIVEGLKKSLREPYVPEDEDDF
jgi:hypothetical protein